MIEVTKIPNKGRGIIATQDIPKGTLIEAAPVVIFSSKQRLKINETELFKYYFVRQSEYSKSKNVNGYLALGLVSLLNHADQPNARVDWIEDEISLWSHLIAEKDIQQGEEVTMFYANIDDYTSANKFV